MKSGREAYIREGLLYFALCFFSIVFYFAPSHGPSMADDPGLGWHLKDGQLIAASLEVPKLDPFLATSTPLRWVSDQWLSDVVMSSAYDLGGWLFLEAAFFALFFTLFFGFVMRSVSKFVAYWPCAAAAVFLAIRMAEVQLIIRPVVFGFLCFAIAYFLIRRFADGSVTRLDAFKVFALFFLWANIHPSFMLGWLLFGFAILQSLVMRGVSSSRRLVLPAIASVVATVINPNGIALHQSILALGSSRYFMRLNAEWLPLDFTSAEGGTYLLVLVCLVVGGALGVYSRAKLYELLAPVAFAVLATRAVRLLPFFAIVSALPLASSFEALLRRYKPNLRELPHRPNTLGVLNFCLGACLTVYFTTPQDVLNDLQMKAGPARAKFPYEALAKLGEADRPESSIKVLTHPDWGGFVTLSVWPRIRAQIDDRNALLGPRPYRDFFAFLDDPNAEKLAVFAPDFVLIPNVPGIEQKFSNSKLFNIIYRDSVSILYRVR